MVSKSDTIPNTFDDIEVAGAYPVLEAGEYKGKYLRNDYQVSQTSGNTMIKLDFQIYDNDTPSIIVSDWLVVSGINKKGQANLNGALRKIKAILESWDALEGFKMLALPLSVFAEDNGFEKVVGGLSNVLPAGHKFYDGLSTIRLSKVERNDGQGFTNRIINITPLQAGTRIPNRPVTHSAIGDDNIPF